MSGSEGLVALTRLLLVRDGIDERWVVPDSVQTHSLKSDGDVDDISAQPRSMH